MTSDSYELLKRIPDSCQGHLRPQFLAEPQSTVFEVVKDLLSVYDSSEKHHNYPPLPESFAVLLPTSPLRTSLDISAAYQKFTESEAECLMSVSEYEYPPQWALEIDEGYLFGYEPKWLSSKRQELPPLYKHNGSIIMVKTNSFLQVSDWHDTNITPWHTPKGQEIDIDNQDQWDYAEYLLRGE